MLTRMAGMIVGFVLIGGALLSAVVWFGFRVYVPADKTLVLIRKTGQAMGADQMIAEAGQKGIQRICLGPGRYFFNPLVWETELHDLIEIPAGDPGTWEVHWPEDDPIAIPSVSGKLPKVGIVTSRAGKRWTGTSEVVDTGYQGIQREVLTPGTYRINPYAYKVELVDAVVVPLGCAGVVTSLLGEMPGVEVITETSIGPDGQPIQGERKQIQKMAELGQRGVLKDILPPGIYYLNPYVNKVTLVQLGYNEISQGEISAQSPARSVSHDVIENIQFPSKDGFTIGVEVTVVWGRHPEHAPEMIARLGDVAKLKEILLGQVRSICRNIGSEYESTDFIRGEKRELYQRAVTETLQRVAKEKDVEILIALIRNIEVKGGSVSAGKTGPDGAAVADLKSTIQRTFIAEEQSLTKAKQQETAKVKAELDTALAAIEVAREQVRAETRKKVAELTAEGEKEAREIGAQRDLDVARIERQIAELEAERVRILGKAEADVQQLKNKAEADGRRMMVEAFGTGHAYNLYTFAESFNPQHISLFYAGDGTFWTDLSRLQDAAAMQILESGEKPKAGSAAKP